MKLCARISSCLAVTIAGLASSSHAATVPVASVYGHNEQDNFGQGFITDMVNGSGMNEHDADGVPGWPAGEGDPSMWTATSNAWQAEWQSRDLLGDGDEGEDIPTNGKVGWVVFDLGSSFADLENLYIWNERENIGRYTASFNVYVATAPAVALSHGPADSTSIDYDFSSGGWVLINGGGALNGAFQGDQVVGLGGITGRYVAIEILANNGDGERVGLAEIAITRTADGSDPPTLAGSDIIDDQGGGPIPPDTEVTYTVSFSKDMDDGTVGGADFGNAGTAPIGIGAVSEIAPGVFSVQVTPTAEGSLRLQVIAAADITDVAGNPLDTSSAIVDDTTIAVRLDAGGAGAIPIADVYGHNEQDNFGMGFITDMINGSGMNDNDADGVPGWPAGEGDPSTWTVTSNAWQAEWQSRDLLGDGDEGEDVPTNGKIGWAVFDLGASTADLEDLYIWNQRENNGRYTASFNVYVANSPAVPLVHGPTNSTSIDYDFSSGGWALINPGGPLNGAFQGDQVVGLGGITGRYVAIEILANNGDQDRVGLAEVAVTAGSGGGGGGDFSDWIAMFPGVGDQTRIGDDPDGDGVDSGVENFFGTGPDRFSAGLVPVAGGGDTFVFTHPQGVLADDLAAAYRWSKDLQNFNADGATGANGTRVDFSVQPDTPSPGTTTVTATVSGVSTDRLFVDVEVTQQ